MTLVNLKVGVRLGLGFGLLLVLMIVMAVLGLTRITDIKDNLDDIVEHDVVAMSNVTEMREAVNAIAIATRNVVMLTDAEDIAAETKRIDSAWKYYDSTAKTLSSMVSNEALLATVGEASAATRPLFDKVTQLAVENKKTEATQFLLKEVQPSLSRWYEAMNDILTAREKIIEESTEKARSAYNFARMLVVTLASAALVLGTLIAWFIARSIVHPLHRAVQVASAVAQGDLSQRIEVKSRDETGQLMQALKDMNDSLVGIVSEVRSNTDSITTASREIAAGNSDLSQRTEEQASSLEETASSMEELNSTVKQNAEIAALVEQAAAAAEAMQEQANGLYVAVSVFKLDGTRGDARVAVAKPALAPPAATKVAAPLRDEKRLSGHPKDGEWKEFKLPDKFLNILLVYTSNFAVVLDKALTMAGSKSIYYTVI